MARDEHDRENLLAEARALVERIELATDAGEVVIGFRRDGCGSVFFAADPVYQFNSRGELRRAFVDGRLVKADGGRLAALQRQRTTEETQLVRHDLNAVETAALLEAMQRRLAELAAALESNAYRVIGVVPERVDVAARCRAWLAALPLPPRIAAIPNVR